jgi:tRNA modification GTPase
MTSDDTIAAISTPPGRGGIGIVRISGSSSERILQRLISPMPKVIRSHHLYHGYVLHPKTKQVLDEVLFCLMRAPKSYTREDVAEIHGHGGDLNLQRILEAVTLLGARIAEPGEFTLRAFMRGRLDLIQAQAVIDIINASTEYALKVAHTKLGGALSEQLTRLKDDILSLLAHIEASIDFPEEEIELWEREEQVKAIQEIIEKIQGLIDSYSLGRRLCQGAEVVILGKPNVGKSSLMNCLVGEQRVIVHPEPGTTRDLIKITVELKGIPVTYVDTAGIREKSSGPERQGIKLALETSKKADLKLVLFDNNSHLDQDDEAIKKLISLKDVIVVITKHDLYPQLCLDELKEWRDLPRVKVSSLTSFGLNTLKELIYKHLTKEEKRSEIILTSLRDYNSLNQVKDALLKAKEGIKKALSEELISLDLRTALHTLSKLCGQEEHEEVIRHIFSKFCIGK